MRTEHMLRFPNRLVGILSVAVAIWFMGLPPVKASVEVGKQTVDRIIDILKAPSPTSTRSEIKLAGLIDYPTIAKNAFTEPQWKAFTPEQQAQIAKSFRTLVEARYYKRWHNIFSRSGITVGNEATSSLGDYVRTYIKHGKETDTVIWHMQDVGGRLKVIDIAVNDESVAQRLEHSAQPRLQKLGPDKFIAWLRSEATHVASGTPSQAM